MNLKGMTLFFMFFLVFSIANAGMIDIHENNQGVIDAIFPELTFNTQSCVTDCEASFKYCLNEDNQDFELDFGESIGNLKEIKVGYYEDITKYRVWQECIDYNVTEVYNETTGNTTNVSECLEYEEHNDSYIETIWNDGLPSTEAGCHQIWIQGKKNPGENVDWIPTLEEKGFVWDTKYSQKKWAWWNDTWGYKTRVNLSSVASSNLTNYPYYIEIDTTNQSVYNNSGMEIRITDWNETTELDWDWNDYSTYNTTNTSIWVKVPELDSANSTYVWVYAGND
ncbi:MAG: DUF2341 domain-containing protein, partial [Candidatus Aenigmatarchaeota archaeon]